MQPSRINELFVRRTFLVIAAVAVLGHAVHTVQMRGHARGQLAAAAEAVEERQPDDLVAALSRYLSFDPGNEAVRGHYALALVERAKDPRQRWRAMLALRQAISSEKSPPEVRVRAVELALELREPEEAARCLAPLLHKDPERVDLLELSARVDVALGRVAYAVDTLRQVLKLAPDRVAAAEWLAALLRGPQDRPRQAAAVLDRFVKDNPGLAAAWLARARDRLLNDKLVPAAEDLSKARDLAPRDVEVLRLSAEVADQRGHYHEAAQLWHRAVAEQPRDAGLHLGLARALKERGLPADGVAALREGLRQLPEQADLTFALADLLIDQGEAREAESLRKKLPQPAAKGREQFLAGRLAQQEKRWLEAATNYVEASQQPDVGPELGGRMMLELSRCYAKMGARDEQFLATLQAARLAPTPRARLVLSEMLVGAGRNEDALPHLRSLTDSPSAPKASHGLLARALLEHYRSKPTWQRRWREVERVLDQADADPSQEVPTAVIRAELLWQRAEPQQARDVLEVTLAEHPDEAVLYLALADLAARQGDEAGSRRALSRGDEALAGRADWLLARAGRLAGHRDPASYRELLGLEAGVGKLPLADRDRLERHLAHLHARLDNQADVERLCRQVLNRHPDDVLVRLLLVDALLARKDDAGAERLVDQLRALEGGDGPGWRCAAVAVRLAQAQRGQRQGLAEAKKLIDEIRKIRPGWSQSDLLGGKLADAEAKPDDALTNYQGVVALGDLHPYALSRLVQLLTEKKRWAEASELLEHAHRQGVLDRELLRPAAWIALQAGNPDRARDLAFLAVPPGSRSYRDLMWLGRLLDAAGRPTEAEEAFQESIQLAPDVAETWLARLGQLLRQGRREDSEELLKRMEDELGASRRRLAVGEAQEMLGQFAAAERTYRVVLRQKPNDAPALGRLLNLYVRRNEPRKAERVLRDMLSGKAAVLEEDIPDLRRRYALILTAPEQPTDRVEEALAVLALNRRELGEQEADRRVAALVRARRPEARAGAIKELEAARDDAKLLPEEQLRLARLYDAEGDWPKARRLLLSLLAHDDDNGGLLAVLIDGLLRHGKKAEAAVYLDRLKKVEPDCPRLAEFEKRLRVRSA